MSALEEYQAASDEDAEQILGRLYWTDRAAFLECMTWEVDQAVRPSSGEPEGW